MADATDINSVPKRRGRKTTASKAMASNTSKRKSATPTVARTRTVSKASEKGFSESVDLAKAAVTSATAAARSKVKGVTEGAKAKVKQKTASAATDWQAQAKQVKAQASKVAHDAADNAKTKTGGAMHGLAKLISETAQTVDTKLGPQYGDYARQAANAVANAANSLDQKDVDQLLGEARDFVRKSPAVAIGAAAIAGYVLMRLAKGSSDDS